MTTSSAAAAVIVLAVLLSFLPLNHSQSDLIEQTCQKVEYHDVCVSALRSDSRSASADVKGLAVIMLDAVKSSGKDIRREVRGEMPRTNDQVAAKCLRLCLDSYGQAIDRMIPDAAAKLLSGAKREAMLITVEAGKTAIDCDSCFTNGRFGPSRGPPSFTNENHKYFYLATAAKDIIGLS